MAGGKVPDAVGSISLTAGDSTDTFSWSAPANGGLPITKYGYQTTTNNGSSWSSETEVLITSAVLTTQYSTSSSKIRVRAYNSLGWGSYSNISSSGTVAWSYGSESDSASCSQGCTCSTCDGCGTSTGTQTGTKSRTCYRYTRSGSTSSGLVDCGSYGSCGSFGGCTSCSGCGSWSSTFDFITVYVSNGVYPYVTGTIWGWMYSDSAGNGYYDGGCGGLAAPVDVQVCNVTGAYRVAGGYTCIYPSCC